MENITFFDGADEVRISISGKFAGVSVREVKETWTKKLAEGCSRRFTVDISALSDYDASGRKLLREMYHHGLNFAAGTAESLVFLSEISSPRWGRVTMLPEQTPDRIGPKSADGPLAITASGTK